MRYEYECIPCKKRFEADVKLKDYDKKVKCPRCNKNMRRVITKAIRFKIN